MHEGLYIEILTDVIHTVVLPYTKAREMLQFIIFIYQWITVNFDGYFSKCVG